MDRLTKEQRSKNMRAVKSKGSKIETVLGAALWSRECRYRKNYAKVTGKPDFVFISAKVAVFCDSEFWHGKDWETKQSAIKSNREFWIPKIERNIARDLEVNRLLSANGWLVMRFWGKEILKNTDEIAEQIAASVRERKPAKKA